MSILSRRLPAGLLLVLLSASACGSDPVAVDPGCPPQALKVLFVGNSLTYTNTLPALLMALVDSAGVGPLIANQQARGGWGLQDHWSSQPTRDQIRFGSYDLVVLQQGPSATSGRPSLIQFGRLFAGVIRESGAEMASYMVWPAEERFFDFDGVLDSYRTLADTTNALFFPAGEAWRVAWETNEDLEFYGSDRFHPAPLGTYMVAMVMFEQLTGCSPVGLPGRLDLGVTQYDIDPETARAVQEAAVEANRRHARGVDGWPPTPSEN